MQQTKKIWGPSWWLSRERQEKGPETGLKIRLRHRSKVHPENRVKGRTPVLSSPDRCTSDVAEAWTSYAHHGWRFQVGLAKPSKSYCLIMALTHHSQLETELSELWIRLHSGWDWQSTSYKEGQLKETDVGKGRGLKCLNGGLCSGSGIRPS